MLRLLISYLPSNLAGGSTAVLSEALDLLGQGQARCRSILSTARLWSRPRRPGSSLAIGCLVDLRRSKSELIAENALLRYQLAILDRRVRRPKLTSRYRLVTVLLARLLPNWRDALHIVKPATVIGWHRRLFKLYWRRKSKPRPGRLPPGTTSLIRRLALENLGRRAYPRRASQARCQGQQTHRPTHHVEGPGRD